MNGPRIGSCARAKTPQSLLIYLIFTSGILSALLVNDMVCLMLTPLVVAVMVRGKLPLPPYLLALAMSANLGSVATLVGNPQNMIIGHLSKISFPALFSRHGAGGRRRFGRFNMPCCESAFERLLSQTVIHRPEAAQPPVDRPLLVLTFAVLGAVFVGFVAGLNLVLDGYGRRSAC